jgi:serine/threonine protein kinase
VVRDFGFVSIGPIFPSPMPDLPAAFTDAISDRYVIEREIGTGGMATVHLARDVRHNRYVAVKVLKPELANSLGAERFLTEIQIAARLTHPHVIPLHDSGYDAGFLYYVMPFVDGESLRARLNRDRCLDLATALAIIQDVGDALSYAHRQGILHRDIKPENIMFAEGHPMVADFGIARAVSTAGGAHITQTGFALGTPGYMSPEQAAGDRDLDARTDVYSLGCVLYEMLLGETPNTWLRDKSLELGRFTDLPDRLRPRMRELGQRIEAALVRALALRTIDRFESVDAFLAAVRTEQRPARRYSDGEVEAIVRRAAEEQLAHPTPEEGLSLKTVKQIADDVGISPERVERAARKLDLRGRDDQPAESGLGAVWLGSPVNVELEQLLAGELSQAAYDEIVDEIQASLSTQGMVDTRGKSLTWRTEKPVLGKARAVQVRVTARGGQTRIQIQERLFEHAWTIFPTVWGIGAGGVAVILSLVGPEIGWTIASLATTVWAGGMYALSRSIFRGVARKKRHDLAQLGERIAGIVAESTGA